MDTKQITEIIKRLELGEPLSKITRDKKLPDASTVYRYCREDEELTKENYGRQANWSFSLY